MKKRDVIAIGLTIAFWMGCFARPFSAEPVLAADIETTDTHTSSAQPEDDNQISQGKTSPKETGESTDQPDLHSLQYQESVPASAISNSNDMPDTEEKPADSNNSRVSEGGNALSQGSVGTKDIVAGQESAKTESVSLYATILNAGYSHYPDLKGSAPLSTTAYYRQTLKVISRTTLPSGWIYYKLVDRTGKVIGFINAKALALGNVPQGKAIAVDTYKSVVDAQQASFSNFNGTVRKAAGAYYKQTLRVRIIYNTFDGREIDSVYDSDNHWIGYFPATSLKEGVGKVGVSFGSSGFATIVKQNWQIYRAFGQPATASSTQYFHQTLRIKSLNYGFDGFVYAGLWDNRGMFVGYLNLNAIKRAVGEQGGAVKYVEKVRITSKNSSIWADFAGHKKATTSQYYDQTVTARIAYYQFGGYAYLSLYTNAGKWIGYLNSNATRTASRSYIKMSRVPNYKQFAWGIPVGCEGVALLQALKAKGYAQRETPTTFLKKIPKASSPYNGFVGSPFVANNSLYTAIFAAPLAKWGNQYGTVRNISGASVSSLLSQVLDGNPVVAFVTVHFAPLDWAKWPFGRVPNNNHAVTVAGYDKTKQMVYISDPIDGLYWMTVKKFSDIYTSRKMAVVVI
ncbi:C39 family peptidase [Lacticaseibacillus mingshuiensis]|uniref:C39 family peptidase n=1 Tax=Lacticaseibacillus mingshuiensis TaxID=2799574 RepID=A0ABW4CH93_9LACO|nr:C39 family peptidase [Lacticaseibacillus mingshuiensis]